MQELTREEIFKNINQTANEYGVSLVTNFKLMNLPEDPILSKTDNDFSTGLFIFNLLLSIFTMSSWWIFFLILVILQIWSGKIKEKLLKTYA